jgi:hypothetical protein
VEPAPTSMVTTPSSFWRLVSTASEVAMVVVLVPIQLVALVLILQVEVLVECRLVAITATILLLVFLLLWRLEMCYRSKVVRVNSFNL